MKEYLGPIEPELKELVGRVISHYEPNKFFGETLGRLYEPYPNLKRCFNKKFGSLLKNMKTEQVVAISNSGLWLGAMAKSLGYDVKILDVHKPFHFQKHKRYGVIHWYYITPKFISPDCKIYDLNDVSTIIESKTEIKSGIKMGVIDFDRIEKVVKTVIVDDTLDQGFSMAVAHKHVLDLGAKVAGRVVISSYSKMPGVIVLDELLSNF